MAVSPRDETGSRESREEIGLPAADVDEAVASLDSARRALVLLGALLYPLSDERAALDETDARAYLAAVAARMQGLCGQSRAVLEHSLRTLARDGGEKRSRRRRRGAQPSVELPETVRTEVDRIMAECKVPDALAWVHGAAGAGPGSGAPLDELVPFAARIAAAAVRLAALAAEGIDPSGGGPAGASSPSGGDANERAAAVASGTGRTARRIAQVLDEWDMLAATPTAMIGCPPPPGADAGIDVPEGGDPGSGRRSLGVMAALGAAGGSAATAARSSAVRRSRTDAVWKSGGAVQRD